MPDSNFDASRAQRAGESILNKDVISDRLDSAKKAAGEVFNSSKKRVMEWEDGIEESVKARPLRSILIAAGVGFAAGLLLRRR
jgi:ElaB/YqjD/DUF883 family membrane-anchored ribosome-binding protein